MPFSANGSTGSTSTSTSEPPSCRTRSEMSTWPPAAASHSRRAITTGRPRTSASSLTSTTSSGVDADAQPAGTWVRSGRRRRTTTLGLVGLLQGDRRADGLGRRLEQRHHAVAERLRHPPTVRLDDLTRLTEVLCHLGHTVRISGFDEMLRGVRDVGEHDRHGGRHRSASRRRPRSSDQLPCLVDGGLGHRDRAPRRRTALLRSGPGPPPCPPARTRRRSCHRTRRRRSRPCPSTFLVKESSASSVELGWVGLAVVRLGDSSGSMRPQKRPCTAPSSRRTPRTSPRSSASSASSTVGNTTT